MKITQTKTDAFTLITVENDAGMTLKLTDVGAGIREITVPDRNGEKKTVTLCPADGKLYGKEYYGKTIGRTSGRVCGATFSIDGKTAALEKNNCGMDNLHGGASGFHDKAFSFGIRQEENFADAEFKYFSKDGEGGYFGNVEITVTYRIFGGQNKFIVFFDGNSDEKTLLNMTNHVYLNMSGNLSEKVTGQTLFLNAPKYGRLNERLIVEEVVDVSKQFDFRTPRNIGEFIDNASVQRFTKGYDHPFFLATCGESGLNEVAASLYSEKSGISLEIRTTYPCVVLYTDNYAGNSLEVLGNRRDEQYLAACLECQYHPDGIHQSPENCGIISPEKPYREIIEYSFKIR